MRGRVLAEDKELVKQVFAPQTTKQPERMLMSAFRIAWRLWSKEICAMA